MTHPLAVVAALLLAAAASHLDVPLRWQVAAILAVVRVVAFAVARAHPLIPRPVLRALRSAVRELISRGRE